MWNGWKETNSCAASHTPTRRREPLFFRHRRDASEGKGSATHWPTPAGRLGAALYENTEAVGLRYGGDRITGVETTIGDIAAGQVVLAAGPWSGLGGRWVAPGGPLDLPVRGVKGQRILLRLPGFLPRSATHNFVGYVAPRLDGNVLVASDTGRRTF